MKEEILVRLKSAEDETAKRIAAAKEKATELVKQARVEAQALIDQAHEEARRDEEARVAAERKKLETERARILQEGQKREETLRANYQKRVAQHVENALQSFERSA